MLVTRPKNILRRNIRPFFASESGKRYSANVSNFNLIVPCQLYILQFSGFMRLPGDLYLLRIQVVRN